MNQEDIKTQEQDVSPEQPAEDTVQGAGEDVEGAAPETEGAGAYEAVVAELKKQVEENQQRFLRAQADFENFRRRARLEKEEFAKYASMKLIEQLLPVIDNFERAMLASKDNADAFAKGVDMIFRQLSQVMEQEGLKVMEAVGQPFNPEFHQAIMTVETEDYEEGTVVEEVQKGYMLKDKVLRPAMVKVSG